MPSHSRNPKHREHFPDFHARKDERKRRALAPRQMTTMPDPLETTTVLDTTNADQDRLASYDRLFRHLGLRLDQPDAPKAPTPLELEQQEAIVRLEAQVASLEEMRPHWAKGYSSDGVAAQSSFAALNALWQMLGARNQTDAISRLKAVLDYPPVIDHQFHAIRQLGIAEIELETTIAALDPDKAAPGMIERVRRAKAYVNAAIERLGLRLQVERDKAATASGALCCEIELPTHSVHYAKKVRA